MKKTIVITSMYGNPIHPGHVECLYLAKKLGHELWVIVNNDKQAELKRGVKSFQDEEYRITIIDALKPVDKTILSIDQDLSVNLTLQKTIDEIRRIEGEDVDIIFAKGGDRFAHEIPEGKTLRDNNVRIVDGLGKKTHNSSDIIKYNK